MADPHQHLPLMGLRSRRIRRAAEDWQRAVDDAREDVVTTKKDGEGERGKSGGGQGGGFTMKHHALEESRMEIAPPAQVNDTISVAEHPSSYDPVEEAKAVAAVKVLKQLNHEIAMLPETAKPNAFRAPANYAALMNAPDVSFEPATAVEVLPDTSANVSEEAAVEQAPEFEIPSYVVANTHHRAHIDYHSIDIAVEPAVQSMLADISDNLVMPAIIEEVRKLEGIETAEKVPVTPQIMQLAEAIAQEIVQDSKHQVRLAQEWKQLASVAPVIEEEKPVANVTHNNETFFIVPVPEIEKPVSVQQVLQPIQRFAIVDTKKETLFVVPVAVAQTPRGEKKYEVIAPAAANTTREARPVPAKLQRITEIFIEKLNREEIIIPTTRVAPDKETKKENKVETSFERLHSILPRKTDEGRRPRTATSFFAAYNLAQRVRKLINTPEPRTAKPSPVPTKAPPRVRKTAVYKALFAA